MSGAGRYLSGVLLVVFALACTGNARAQGLSPDLTSLRSLVRELQRSSPPLDPQDADAIRDDVVAALSNTSGSNVPYMGVPEWLLATRLAGRCGALFYHRFGSPAHAGSIMNQVLTMYTAAPGAAAQAAAAGLAAKVAGTSQLSPQFRPASTATTDLSDLGGPDGDGGGTDPGGGGNPDGGLNDPSGTGGLDGGGGEVPQDPIGP